MSALGNVLTVEDDPIVRADLRLVLEDAGFTVCAGARDGVEAIELARLHQPDLILLDLGLPRLDGVAAAEHILREQDVPIVALTGRSEAHAESALDAGAMTWLGKPFNDRELVETVVATLSEHRAARELAARREESRTVLAELVVSLGYPETMAATLEESAYRSGRIWRRSDR